MRKAGLVRRLGRKGRSPNEVVNTVGVHLAAPKGAAEARWRKVARKGMGGPECPVVAVSGAPKSSTGCLEGPRIGSGVEKDIRGDRKGRAGGDGGTSEGTAESVQETRDRHGGAKVWRTTLFSRHQ